jgi:hypothetical protein
MPTSVHYVDAVILIVLTLAGLLGGVWFVEWIQMNRGNLLNIILRCLVVLLVILGVLHSVAWLCYRLNINFH